MFQVVKHADYPHEPGRLYDCEACEAECFCRPGETSCVHCALAEDENERRWLAARGLY